ARLSPWESGSRCLLRRCPGYTFPVTARRRCAWASAPSSNTCRLLARDHAAPESTLALAKAASLGRERVRPLAWCSRPRNSAALLDEALATVRLPGRVALLHPALHRRRAPDSGRDVRAARSGARRQVHAAGHAGHRQDPGDPRADDEGLARRAGAAEPRGRERIEEARA